MSRALATAAQRRAPIDPISGALAAVGALVDAVHGLDPAAPGSIARAAYAACDAVAEARAARPGFRVPATHEELLALASAEQVLDDGGGIGTACRDRVAFVLRHLEVRS